MSSSKKISFYVYVEFLFHFHLGKGQMTSGIKEVHFQATDFATRSYGACQERTKQRNPRLVLYHMSNVELVSKELNHLAAILHVYAGALNFMK